MHVIYPVYNKRIKITTASHYGSSDQVDFSLFDDKNSTITNIVWRFKNWACNIGYCTLWGSSLKLRNVPHDNIKTWVVTATTMFINIRCNNVEVLNFMYHNADVGFCDTEVKGRIVTGVSFHHFDTATKQFCLEGKPTDYFYRSY